MIYNLNRDTPSWHTIYIVHVIMSYTLALKRTLSIDCNVLEPSQRRILMTDFLDMGLYIKLITFDVVRITW